MAGTALVEPDLEFKRNILGLGARDLTTCYQCGTCSVVCPIASDADPFPRKEMIWIQWGLKNRLLTDPALWLCHQCSLCNAYCPRDAKPADVMAALRDYSITHYAVPRFMGRAVSAAKYSPFLFALPVVIFLAVLGWLGNLTSHPTGEIVFSKFMPIIYIEIIFILAVGVAVGAAIIGGVRYWKGMSQFSLASRDGGAAKGLIPTLLDVLKHRKFQQCEGDRVGTRKSYKSHLHWSHLAVFYGFLGLAVTTTSVGIGIYAFGYLTPWPLWHPAKILGNMSGVAVLMACGVFLYRRLKDRGKGGKSTYSDWLFLWVLVLTTFTGFLSQILRLADIPPLAYWIYFIHLVFIFCLLVYIPYSKFAHLVYRFVAMLYSTSISLQEK
ncbi:MAG: quinone-interacting membrane-bound oxidoreductase complex subunit QmoC [Candidatus Binatia bacterium]